MPHRSRWTVPVPPVSLPTYMLGDPTAPLGDGLAYADADEPSELSMTWTGFRLWCQRFAAGLQAAGLRKGDRVVSFCGNSVFFPVIFTGTVMAGGIFSPANAHFVAGELAYQLRVCEPRFVLVSKENAARALEAVRMLGMAKESLFLFDDAPLRGSEGGDDNASHELRNWKRLLAPEAIGRAFVWEELGLSQCKETTIALVFSSGTTGLPKGVELTHYTFAANAAQTNYVMNLDSSVATPKLSAQNSRWLCALPLYHGLGLVYFANISVRRRIATYIMRNYQLNSMLESIERFRITELHLVPPIIIAMTKHSGIMNGLFNLSSVTKTFSCAAPLGADPTRQYEALWPQGVMNVKQGLAMSESCCNTIGWDPRLNAPAGSVGEPMPNCEIQLVDDDSQEVVTGQRGEIWVRCPNIMKGYWNNKKATEDTITRDGWLKTGDVACRDSNGYYYVVDRKKEMIKVKGVQVAPAALEAILLDHPGVADAAVIGIKSDGDEMPRAYVVANPSVPTTEKDIADYVAGKVSSIQKLTGGVVFTSIIPKTPSGKILRRILREEAATSSKL